MSEQCESKSPVTISGFAVISLVKLTDYNRSNISMCTLNSKMNAGCMFVKKNLVRNLEKNSYIIGCDF